MANRTRKTRNPKVETIRVRFGSAADAKAVEERMNVKATFDVERRGRTITIPSNGFKALARAADAESVSGTEVGARGRPKNGEAPELRTVGPAPTAKRAKKPKKVLNTKKTRDVIAPLPSSAKIGEKKGKAKYVILCPAGSDASKLAKAISGKRDGARVVIIGGDEKSVRIAAKSAARSLEIPIILESGFTKNPKTVQRKKAGKKTLPKKSGKTKPVVSIVLSSSNLAKAWYNLETNNLTLEFTSGAKYRYSDVSLREFKQFVLADSQGQFFTANIKDVKPTKKLSAA